MSRLVEAMSEAAASNVGPRPHVPGQVGDPTRRNPANQATRPGQLRRGLLWQVAQQSGRGREDAARGCHVDAGVPAGGGHYEEVPAQAIGGAVCRLQQGGADLYCSGVYV